MMDSFFSGLHFCHGVCETHHGSVGRFLMCRSSYNGFKTSTDEGEKFRLWHDGYRSPKDVAASVAK